MAICFCVSPEHRASNTFAHVMGGQSDRRCGHASGRNRCVPNRGLGGWGSFGSGEHAPHRKRFEQVARGHERSERTWLCPTPARPARAAWCWARHVTSRSECPRAVGAPICFLMGCCSMAGRWRLVSLPMRCKASYGHGVAGRAKFRPIAVAGLASLSATLQPKWVGADVAPPTARAHCYESWVGASV